MTQLKQFLMVNTKMFRHPKYYKELRKRNKSDRVISNAEATAASERAPGQGLKQQAIEETVPHNDIEEASSIKLQAPGVKLSNQPVQAASDKHQAPGSKLQASSRKRQAQ
jgi:hypothetical protein